MMDENAYISNLRDAVIARDPYSVRYLLDNKGNPLSIENGENLLHLLVKVSARNKVQNADTETRKRVEQQLVYMLCDAGFDVDTLNEETPLQCAVRCHLAHLCDVLLRCGSDMNAITTDGSSIWDFVYQMSSESDLSEDNTTVLEVFQKYQPGLLRAVTTSSISQVRRLTNLWCKTDLEQDGKTLRELALETGHEEIIDLILGIHSTMKLVHHVLARNTKAARDILQSDRNNLQLNIRNMSDNGAPILFYAIRDHDAELIKHFVDKGSRVYTMMRDNDSHDMPVLFTAIKPNVPTEVIEALLPKDEQQQEELLYRLLYKGQNVLEIAIERRVHVKVFSVLIDRGGPMLLACRNKLNQTIEDVALQTKNAAYKNIITEKIILWLTRHENFHSRRKILALWGYEWPYENYQIASQYPAAERFLEQLPAYQEQIYNITCAVENGDIEMFQEMCTWTEDSDLFETNLAWAARVKGDGLPLLHRAVLYNRPEIVKLILEHKPQHLSVDSLLDQFHRTALHYAYGIAEAEKIRSVLLISGCSEHTLDKNGCEPLDFKIKQGTEEMELLLAGVKENVTNPCETEWWSECQWNTTENKPSTCHFHQRRHSIEAESDSDETQPGNLQYTIRCEIL